MQGLFVTALLGQAVRPALIFQPLIVQLLAPRIVPHALVVQAIVPLALFHALLMNSLVVAPVVRQVLLVAPLALVFVALLFPPRLQPVAASSDPRLWIGLKGGRVAARNA